MTGDETQIKWNEKKVVTTVDFVVGERIRTFRRELGWSQKQLAEPLGVSYQQVQKYENATDRVTAARLFTIAQALGRPVGDFFPGAKAGKDVASAQSRVRRAHRAGLRRLIGEVECADREALVEALCAVIGHWPSGTTSEDGPADGRSGPRRGRSAGAKATG